ncbi:MAG: hypothetical protein K2W82_04590 [Candidatus Obscuribacterales bacterium]|nr:hypothetical protein [Candidatus Obscuribacterales bacterium]
MSDQNFVYAVFRNNLRVLDVVGGLHTAGFTTAQIGVLGAKGKQFKYLSGKVEDPSAKNFIRFGIAGCFGGLCAGISALRLVPEVVTFQILTPLMAAISGGAIFAYFGCYMSVFLNSTKPQHWANIFEGTVEAGSIIIVAECNSRDEMRTAMAVMDAENPVELIAREKALPWAIKSEVKEPTVVAVPPVTLPAEVEPATPVLTAVA